MNTNYTKYDYLFKLLFIGDSGCGKSSIVIRFTDNVFDDVYSSTIGIDFKVRTLDIDGKIAKLQIWDTAGQERFKTIISSYYRGVHGIIMVYDITNKQSFDNIKEWINEINKYASPNVEKLLIGNKLDLKKYRVVKYEDAQELADSLGIPYIETSAKSATNINKAFLTMTTEIKTTMTNKPISSNLDKNTFIDKNITISLNESKKEKNNNCC